MPLQMDDTLNVVKIFMVQQYDSRLECGKLVIDSLLDSMIFETRV